MKMKKLLTLLLAVLLLAGCAGNKPGTFEAGKNTFLLNGKPFVVKAAEVHYPRIPREYWEHRIEMCMRKLPVSMILQVIKILQLSVNWLRSMVCTSLCVPVRMYVRNGKWVGCLGGC